MNIAYIDYSLQQKSLDIYVAGCSPPHCKGCHNPELWDFDYGIFFTKKLNEIINYFNKFNNLIDKVFIMGGEPLDQDINCLKYLICCCYSKEIWLFTKYQLNEISNVIKYKCDYIKTGKYNKDLKTDNNVQYGVQLATSNQNIYKRGEGY